jgi:DNA-binding FadR family transcriptional regulator
MSTTCVRNSDAMVRYTAESSRLNENPDDSESAAGPTAHRFECAQLTIYQARIALKAEAAAAAARRATELDLTRVRHVQQQANAASDPAQARALHARWHTVLAQASHNGDLLELLERLAGQLAPVGSLYRALADAENPQAAALGHHRLTTSRRLR